ncbi:FkbM family methyltransferase [Sulfurimonas sp.]
MWEKIKKIKRVLTNKDFFYKNTIQINDKKVGSSYGGWWIATDILKEPIVLSFGLGEDVTFDKAMIEDYNARVYGFDPTPKSIKYVESLNLGEKFSLYPYALSDSDGVLTFNLPKNDEHVSGSLVDIPSSETINVKCHKLESIYSELMIKNIDILKMDIEGAEYKIVEDIVKLDILPTQILIEYHHFFDNIEKKDTLDSIALLLQNGYELFHIDGYNYSFINMNRDPN